MVRAAPARRLRTLLYFVVFLCAVLTLLPDYLYLARLVGYAKQRISTIALGPRDERYRLLVSPKHVY